MEDQISDTDPGVLPDSTEGFLESGVLLVDSYDLFREGMKLLLRELGYRLVTEANSIASVLRFLDKSVPPALILFGIHPGKHVDLEDLCALRRACSTSRLVCYSDPKIDPQNFLEALRIGIDGYVLTDIKPKVLKQSLDLILLGAPIYPAAIAVKCLDRKLHPTPIPISGADQSISYREKQILLCLANGYSNKMISRELRISEATVKVHVKLLLKKLAVANRTQAAIWAVNNCAALNGPIGGGSAIVDGAPSMYSIEGGSSSRSSQKPSSDDRRKAGEPPLPEVA